MIESILTRIVYNNPEQIAVVDEEKRFTYNDLYLMKQEFVQFLKNDLKINRGEKIAIFLPNCVEFIFSFFAIAEVGAIFIPLNTHLTERELQYYIDKFGITSVITNSHLQPQLGEISGQMGEGRFVIMDRRNKAEQNNRDFCHTTDDIESSKETNPDTDVLYLSTSGSTGAPKIVRRSAANLISGAMNVEGALGVTKEDIFLSVVPFYHANGFSNCMFLPIIKGATIVLMRQFLAGKMIQVMQKERITILFGSPFIYSIMSDISGDDSFIQSIRLFISTGAPMPEDLKKIFLNIFGASVRQLYGSSETGTISIQLGNLIKNEGSVGSPLKTVEIKIIDDEGKELLPNQKGEIVVRSPAMTKGYVDEPELNAKVFHNGYFRTGDTGLIDKHGNLYISGRKNRVINAAGVKVDPVEIENILVSFHKVKEAVVVGVKSRRGMEIIKAILVAQPDCKVSDVIGYCKNKIADYKIPRIINFRDAIPRDAMGKFVSTREEDKDGLSNS